MISIRGSATSNLDRLDPRFVSLEKANERLARKDASLWGPRAEKEAAHRLNWIDLPETSRALLPELDALAAKFRHCTRVILCGMGGSSLAPEVIAASFGKKLFVLDSTDPNYISHALDGDLSKTVVIISSKSGSTIETAAQRSLFESELAKGGLDPREHMVIVTDPDSPLDQHAREQNFAVINADPDVGGRFSALTAFGLVPAALIGIDVSVILDSASDALSQLHGANSPAVATAYLLAYHSNQYFALSDASPMPGLSDWVEQLVAESTGKEGVGRLPVVIESNAAPIGSDVLRIAFAGNSDLVIDAELGAQFIFWEWTTALLGHALEIDPFNQPNVTETKKATASLLNAWSGKLPELKADHIDGAVEIFSDSATIQDVFTHLINAVESEGYIAIMAYLDRRDDREIGELREILAEKSGRPVTFGWGPRLLHSTGQFHKGGQQNGVFIQITGEPDEDREIPGMNFTFQTLISAQAQGDAQTLISRNLTVVHLHLRRRAEGISEILTAARTII